MRVLIADDSRTMRCIVRQMMSDVGEIYEAADGGEAIEMFAQHRFDLVITDLMMPVCSGLDVLRSIRENGSNVPVAICSTHVQRKSIMQAIDFGASAYLIKPFTPQCRMKLLNILRTAQAKPKLLGEEGKFDVRVVNPFIASTVAAFRSMLNCKLGVGEAYKSDSRQALHDISGVTVLRGETHGAMALTLSRQAALAAMIPIAAQHPTEITIDVIDMVAELTNVIVGNAQGELGESSLTFDPPEVVAGKTRCLEFPSESTPVCIPFTSDLGPLALQIGVAASPERPDCPEEK